MTRQKHCKQCIEVLGKTFEYVHVWLDEFADGSYSHRRYRHHEAGIEQVRTKWGDEAALAARLHIEQDWGYVPTELEYDDMHKMKFAYYQRRGLYIPRNT